MGRKGKRTKGIEEAHPFAATPALLRSAVQV